ncbi:MAG: class I SAM-dependent methyltransferase [Pyrinomonadaceae bacterium]
MRKRHERFVSSETAQQERRCKLCDEKTVYKFSLPLVAGLRGEYFECTNCRMLQSRHLDVLTAPGLVEIADYDPNADLDSGAAWRMSCLASRLEQLVKLKVVPRARSSFRALDFGCGTGFLVSYMAHRFGWSAIGYDPFWTPAYALDKVFTEWEQVAEKAPYNLIVASEVFEHFTDPKNELLRIRETLAKDIAFLYVTTGLYVPGKTTEGWNYLAPQSGHHVSFYARRTMQEVARLVGASGVYQIGANYEWLFVFGERYGRWSQKVNLALASTLLGLATRSGISSVIE